MTLPPPPNGTEYRWIKISNFGTPPKKKKKKMSSYAPPPPIFGPILNPPYPLEKILHTPLTLYQGRTQDFFKGGGGGGLKSGPKYFAPEKFKIAPAEKSLRGGGGD